VASPAACSIYEEGTEMKLDINGSEVIAAAPERLWQGLNDPALLARCIPGCRGMTPLGPDAYKIELQLRVAAVGGSFEGEIGLRDKEAPRRCRIAVSGAGSLGHGNGEATFEIAAHDHGSQLTYSGNGEIGGLVAGVGQRILGSVSKHLIGRFFTALRNQVAMAEPGAAE
jgi:carbon monoxide dehydrogenase subunit G